ncbi:OmpA family protein [uncultured Draconibacterium sp.]|uniref:OmpA family protein n=1 Tax=uncultured Draconibacterium sp. TaxID=1573823 RepID=UPI003216B234
MKRGILFIAPILFLFFTLSSEAQVKNVENEVEKQGTKRINHKIDTGIDKGFDAIEDGIGSLFGKKKKKNNKEAEQVETTLENTSEASEQQSAGQQTAQSPAMNVQWSKFDFVPGDEVIFEDAPSADEENGEFPSRWDLVSGQVEIANVNGENVMMFIDGTPEIVPYLKNSKDDYLPEVFTIEFDFYKPVEGNRISVYLYDDKNQEKVDHDMYMDISSGGVSEKLSDVTGDFPGIDYKNSDAARWIHVSIAFTKGKLKVYMDDTRVINIPHYEGNPTGLSLQAYWADLGEEKPYYFKNIRIAKGGVKYYDRVLSDGKIIVNGIRFDVNKASIKPESNGAINEIYELMQKQPELNFSVEGHTDSDGDDAFNQSLSEARAKAIKDRLINMGISSKRLKSAGWGESKPIADNGTAEGKANNRRVEFVKFEGSADAAIEGSASSGNSVFDKMDRKAINVNLEKLPESFNVPISNQSGMVNDVGTIIMYATGKGNLGKMEILDVDKSDNYKITVRYVTYNSNGSVHSQSDHLEIEGTFNCDLDEGKSEDVDRADADFQLGRQDKTTTTLYQIDESLLRVFPN